MRTRHHAVFAPCIGKQSRIHMHVLIYVMHTQDGLVHGHGTAGVWAAPRRGRGKQGQTRSALRQPRRAVHVIRRAGTHAMCDHAHMCMTHSRGALWWIHVTCCVQVFTGHGCVPVCMSVFGCAHTKLYTHIHTFL